MLWLPYSTAGGAGKIYKLTCPTHPSTTLFHAALPLIIKYDHSLIRQAWLLAQIPHLVTLYLSRNATRLVMVLLCLLSTNSFNWSSMVPPQSKLLTTQVPFHIAGEVQYRIPTSLSPLRTSLGRDIPHTDATAQIWTCVKG